MINFLRSALLGVIALALGATHVAGETLSDADRAQIEGVVREYILKNPELIEEALVILEAKRKAEEAAKRKEMLSKNGEMLFNSTRQVVLGNPEGDVTVVEFFDYNCGVCRRAFNDMQRILKEDGNVRFVLKEFPILGRGSNEAARVAIALNLTAPEKYGEFHNLMFSQRGTANEARALATVEKLGVDMAALRANMNAPEVIATVEEVYALANGLGLNGTPSYVIGDEVYGGLIGHAKMKSAIAGVRECGQVTC